MMHRRAVLSAAALLALRPDLASAQPAPIVRRFATPADLAAYTRLSALSQPLIMAHRAGYKPHAVGYPECSLVSAQRVVETGPAMIEVDVRRTGDGVMVPLHDETLDRETTGTGPVSGITFAAFKALRLRDATGEPTDIAPDGFEDFLDWSRNGALLWLDTKDVDPAELVALIRDKGAEARVIVSAYGRETLEAYQAQTQDLVHFVPLIAPLGLATMEDVNAAGLDDGRMIGFAGYYVPDVANTEAMRERDVPAVLDLNRLDQRVPPDRLDPMVYERAVATGFPMLNTDQYAAVMAILGLRDWA